MNSTCQAYSPQTCGPMSHATGHAVHTASTLPFTGLSLVLILVVALALIAFGIALRYWTHRGVA